MFAVAEGDHQIRGHEASLVVVYAFVAEQPMKLLSCRIGFTFGLWQVRIVCLPE